jgi:hypothetical protein
VKKSQLSDKQLEEILGQLPKIKDNRDPRDIYQNIAHRVEKSRRMPAWVVPGAAFAAVLFLAFILAPGLMDWNQSADKSIESKSGSETNTAMDMDTATKDKTDDKSDTSVKNNLMMDTTEKSENKEGEFMAAKEENPYAGLSSLYEEELSVQDSEIITYAIPDQNAQVLVPVSVSVPKEENKQWIDSFTESMSKLKEKEWGLSEFYPADGTWSYDEASKTLNFDVKQDHIYRQGSTNSDLFLEAMSHNLAGQEIEKLSFTTEQVEGIEFGNYGPRSQGEIATVPKDRRAYLFLSAEGVQTPYLVPTKVQFETIDEAFAQMWGDIEDQSLTASLPENLKLDKMIPEKKVLRIYLLDSSAINEEFLLSLEAILLTAKEFDYKAVKIENAGVDQLGPFNLNEELTVPVAPNKKNIE